MRTLAKDIQWGIFFAILTAGLFIGGFEAGSRYERRHTPIFNVINGAMPGMSEKDLEVAAQYWQDELYRRFPAHGILYSCGPTPNVVDLAHLQSVPCKNDFVTVQPNPPADTALADEARKDLRKPTHVGGPTKQSPKKQ